MKKLLLAGLFAISTIALAQEEKKEHEKLTLEQKTELRVKQMTLELDLNADQQNKLKKLFLEEGKKRELKLKDRKALREKGERPSADDRFKTRSERLDQQIEMKSKLKEILDEKQLDKWNAMHTKKSMSRKNKKDHIREMK